MAKIDLYDPKWVEMVFAGKNKEYGAYQLRKGQKFTAPVIKKDELVKEENQVKQMDKLDEKVAVGTENKEGTKDRLAEAVRSDIAVAAPPPPPAPKPEVSNKVFDVVEEMPHFPGGAAALQAFLSSNTKYPVVAQENGVQGRVIVSFVVERDGSITDVRVVRSVDPSLDREASRVVRSMPRWSPGKQNGSAVRVKYTVPVVFRLQ